MYHNLHRKQYLFMKNFRTPLRFYSWCSTRGAHGNLAGKVVELNKMVESWKNKYQKSVEECDNIQKQLDDVRKENGKLSNDNQLLQEISDRYDRVVRILGMETVEDVVQQDIKEQRALEEKRRTEQMPKGSVLKQLEWATQKSQIENQQRKKNKTKYKGLEI